MPEIKLFQTDVDEVWNNFVLHATTALNMAVRVEWSSNFRVYIKNVICVDCWLTGGRPTDVLYNKFNVDSSSPPDNPPQRPNSYYNCVVATTGQWRVSRCDEQHHVVCQSDYDTLTGIMFSQKSSAVHIFIAICCVALVCFASVFL